MTERVERLTAFLADGQIEDPLAAFLDRVRRLNSEIVRDPFLRRVLLEQGHVYEPRLRERGQQLVDAFGALAVAELTRLTESGAAQCDDPPGRCRADSQRHCRMDHRERFRDRNRVSRPAA